MQGIVLFHEERKQVLVDEQLSAEDSGLFDLLQWQGSGNGCGSTGVQLRFPQRSLRAALHAVLQENLGRLRG